MVCAATWLQALSAVPALPSLAAQPDACVLLLEIDTLDFVSSERGSKWIQAVQQSLLSS